MFNHLVPRVVGKEGGICSKRCLFLLEWTNQAPVVQRLLLPKHVMFIIEFLSAAKSIGSFWQPFVLVDVMSMNNG